MRRAGNLMGAVCEPENLRLAFWKASRGRRWRPEQRAYAANLEGELAALREGLLDGSFPVGDYRTFVVREPKERTIHAAAFRERVLHHALMNVLEPWFEKWLIGDTYACRKGKGQEAAVRRAVGFARKYGWFLKCDVRKYFESIPHAGIERMLERKIKDRDVLAWFGRIVATHESSPGRGLPIGNLTSQHLANLYLDRVDRLPGGGGWRGAGGAGEAGMSVCGKVGYVRYMDDFVFWGEGKDELRRVRDGVARALGELGLEWKGDPALNRTGHGMDFLGRRVYPQGVRLSGESLRRFARKAKAYERMREAGLWGEQECQERMMALTAFAMTAETRGWRRQFFGGRAERPPRDPAKELAGRTACNAAEAGTMARTTAVLRDAATTTRRTATTTMASGSSAPQHRMMAHKDEKEKVQEARRRMDAVPAGGRFAEGGECDEETDAGLALVAGCAKAPGGGGRQGARDAVRSFGT